jgi:two-component system, chemotaxis family, protein-glutamate methylesterase/glutaminase
MTISKKIKVLIVDDSLLFREVIARGISTDSNIEVIAKAVDPFDARDKILKYEPNVMICDVEMPKMNGIEFLKKLLPQYPLPVIVVSSINDSVFQAMNAGAVDFVTKPDVQNPKSVEAFIQDLIGKIKIASQSKITAPTITTSTASPKADFTNGAVNRVIAIGASTGGTEAIYRVLKQLPPNVPGILVVQHIPPMFSRMFAERLNHQIELTVVEAQSGDFVEPGKVLIAPGDQHMRVKKAGGKYRVEVYSGEKVNGHCPSVDILFDSVAKEVGSKAIGVILTGMGYDGAKGLLAMRRKGARTIGQDEKSSVVYGMPKVAYEIGAVEKQSDIENIPILLSALLR